MVRALASECMHAGAAARVLYESQRVGNTLCWLVVHTPVRPCALLALVAPQTVITGIRPYARYQPLPLLININSHFAIL